MRIQYKLPKFKGNKKLTPYEQFYVLGRKKLGMTEEQFKKMEVSNFMVSENTGKELDVKELAWMIKCSDKKFMGKKYIKRAFKMYWLQWSPKTVKTLPDGVCEVVWMND